MFLFVTSIPAFSQKGDLLLNIKILEPFKNKLNGQNIEIKFIGYSNSDFPLPLNDTLINNLDSGSNALIIRSSIKVGKFNKYFSSLIPFEIYKDSTTLLRIIFPDDCDFNKNALNNICPKCKQSDKVLPIEYGLSVPLFDKNGNSLKTTPTYPGGCMVSNCDPTWFCKRDKIEF